MTITHTREIVKFDKIPAVLKAINQWVVWKRRDASKVPINHRTGKAHDASVSEIWLSFEDAVRESEKYDGIGLYPTPDLNLTCLDVDVDDDGEVQSYFRTYAE